MGQAQPFQHELSKPIDHLASLRRLLADMESHKTAIVSDGIDATSTYTMILKAQIEYLDVVLGG